MKDLEADLRKVMAPNTGAALRESKRNVLKDFVHIAGPLGVTHFLILTATQNASYLRIAKTRVRSSPTCDPSNGHCSFARSAWPHCKLSHDISHDTALEHTAWGCLCALITFLC